MKRLSRRMLSVLLCLSMLLAFVPVSAQASAATMNIRITPSATAAQVGDTVEFVVTAEGSGITAMQFELDLPEGMTYVAGSATIPSGLKSYLGWAATDWTENKLMWTGYNDLPSTFEEGTVILTFSCTMEAEGVYDVDLYEFWAFDDCFEEIATSLMVDQVTVSGKKEPTVPDDPFVDISVVPSVSEAEIGDTIDYTVYAHGDRLAALQFELIIPEGMTYVAGSGAVPSGLKSYLGWAVTDWNESMMLWTGYNDLPAVFEKDTVILTFSCTVEAEGTYEVELYDLLPFDEHYEEFAPTLSVGSVIVEGLGLCTHSFTNYVSNADATCTENGTETAKCDYCEETDTREVENSWTGHNMNRVDATVTCTQAGNIAYYVCSNCDVMFADATASIPVQAEDVQADALGHSDWDGDMICDRCDYVMKPITSDEPAVPVDAFFNVTVVPSVSQAEIGDTIDYTVYAHGQGVTALQFNLMIPEGMTYVAGSGAVPSGLKSYLGWEATDWTESSMMWTGYNVLSSVFEKDTVILTFSCTVEAVGIHEIEFFELLPFDENYDEFEAGLTVGQVEVSKEAVPTEYTRVYCLAPSAWTSCKAYWWGSTTGTNPSWPGVDMSQDENGIWFYDVPSNATGLIFNNGNGVQTSDLVVPTDDYCMYVFENSYWVTLPGDLVIQEPKYYVAGEAGLCGVDWDPDAEANRMFDEDQDGIYTLIYTGVAAGTYEFLITDGTWDHIGAHIENYKVTVAVDNSTVEIRFDSQTGAVEAVCTPPIPDGPFMIVTVVPSSGEVEVGDTVDYTVYAHGDGLTALQFELIIPEGMSFVKGSGAVPSGLKDYLGWAATDWTESSGMWTGYSDLPATFGQNTVILTFSCVAEKEGTYAVELFELLPFDENYEEFAADLFVGNVNVVDPCTNGHSYEAVVTAPTCLYAGFTTYTCVCGDSYVADETQALGHSFTDYVSNGNATCTADGTKTAQCDRCNRRHTVVDEGSALGHSFTDYVSNGDATCTEYGTKTAQCDRCDWTHTVVDEGSALGHSFINYVSNGDADCYNDGTKTAKCDRCNVTDTVADAGSVLGHSFTHYVSNGDADCYNDGTKTAKCDRCAKRDTVIDENTALGHSFTNYISNGDADCLNDGTKTSKCDRCVKRNTVIDENSALGHSFTDYVSNGDADCLNDGTKTAKCDRCVQTHTVIDVGTGKHQMHYSPNNDATCMEDGTQTGTCSVCGYIEIVADPGTATGHRFTNYVSNGNYTCTADGTKTAKCDNCDVTDTVVDIDSADHRYEHGFCVFCGERGKPNAVLKGILTLAKDGDALLTLSANGQILATMNAQNGAYTMDVWSGEVILTITMEGCATREYAITLTEGENVLDLTLNQKGDINGDGKINAGDVARVYAHIKKTNMVADDYQLLCADYTGDGRLNVGDTSKIYALVKNR